MDVVGNVDDCGITSNEITLGIDVVANERTAFGVNRWRFCAPFGTLSHERFPNPKTHLPLESVVSVFMRRC